VNDADSVEIKDILWLAFAVAFWDAEKRNLREISTNSKNTPRCIVALLSCTNANPNISNPIPWQILTRMMSRVWWYNTITYRGDKVQRQKLYRFAVVMKM